MVLGLRQVRPGQVYRDRDPRSSHLVVVDHVTAEVRGPNGTGRSYAHCTRYGDTAMSTRIRVDRLTNPRLFDYVRTQASERDTRC